MSWNIFGGDDPPPRARDAGDDLLDAVSNKDPQLALKLLKESGDACKAEDLAKLAKSHKSWVMDWSISQTENTEKIDVYYWGAHSDFPVAGYTFPKKCER